ncbi:MAG: SEC-C domain-containing protein [bacterium]|nr:SEC-C domain-containing protein [bacterium]
MGSKPRRNAPCPCGSGKKYKLCCQRADAAAGSSGTPSPRSYYGPGAAPPPGGVYYLPGAAHNGYGFWPVVSSYRAASEAGRNDELIWLLVDKKREYRDKDKGLRAAEAELELVFGSPLYASQEAMAEHLKKQGFTSISDYRVAQDYDDSPKDVLGGDYVMPFMEEAARADPGIHAMVMQTVENQLANNDPPETRETLQRLIDAGHSPELSRRLIGAVVTVELTKEWVLKQPFDRARFVENLKNLPELPPPALPPTATGGG